jgi:4-hydroxybenzoate polyprenyltransferase
VARSLALACHPGPVVAVTAISIGYAVSRHRSTHGIVLVGLAVLAGQLSTGWQNDALDADEDRRNLRSSKPIVADSVARSSVAAAAFLAGLACVPLSLASGWKAGTIHLGAVAFALAYNLGLKATIFSALCYAAAFGALPVFVASGAPGSPLGPWWAAAAAAALGIGAHVVNTLPDRAADLASGSLGLPQRLSLRTDALVAGGAFVAASGALSFGPGHLNLLRTLSFALSAAGGLAIAGISARNGRLAFRLCLLLAALDVALLLLAGR